MMMMTTTTTSNRQVVAVRRQSITPCMTCPICDKLLKDATTITECLHTFCRNCIYDKITEEELDNCPVCNVYLGCAPLEKLRADHSMQDIRGKIFGYLQRRESKEPEVVSSNPLPAAIDSEGPELVPSAPLPTRRKERSLSSLVCSPEVSDQTVITRGKKLAARKIPASQGSNMSIKEPTKNVEDSPESPSPHATLSEIMLNKKQNFSAGESFKQHIPIKDAEDPVEPLEGMTDLWKPLNCLVEAVGITKSSKSSVQGYVAKSEPPSIHEDGARVNKIKSKERAKANKSKVQNGEGRSNPVPSDSVKPKKVHPGRPKKATASEVLNIAPQAVVNAAGATCHRRVNPIWFSLIASDAQEGNAPLPQIPSCYLMIKNSNLPVSFIQKYIVQKLDLDNEAEVEITLQGYPLLPTLRLHHLIDLWMQIAPKSSETVTTTVGSSAKEYVMVLCYGRKAQHSS